MAVFFKSPESTVIIQVVGITILLRSFTNIGIIYFQKELKFNKQFLCQFSSTIANFSVAVFAAKHGAVCLLPGPLADVVADGVTEHAV